MRYFGTVDFFDPRGFGFIKRSDGQDDIFFHVSQLPGQRGKRSIPDGQNVSFEVGTRQGKPAALNVLPFDLEAASPENGGDNGRQE